MYVCVCIYIYMYVCMYIYRQLSLPLLHAANGQTPSRKTPLGNYLIYDVSLCRQARCHGPQL